MLLPKLLSWFYYASFFLLRIGRLFHVDRVWSVNALYFTPSFGLNTYFIYFEAFRFLIKIWVTVNWMSKFTDTTMKKLPNKLDTAQKITPIFGHIFFFPKRKWGWSRLSFKLVRLIYSYKLNNTFNCSIILNRVLNFLKLFFLIT